MKTRIFLTVLAAVATAAVFTAWPFYTVWQIREATRTGNSQYLAEKIEWSSVKETLKPAIAQMALNLPPEVAAEEGAPQPKRSLWQRFKAYMGEGVVNRVVDKYVTPEGLPQLFTYKKTYNSVRDQVTGVNSDPQDLSFPERFKRFWARVERAEFKSLTRFEIDVRDKLMPERRFDGVLELRGLEWKLTELRVRDSSPAQAAATARAAPVLTDAGTPVTSDAGPAETLPSDK